MKITKITLYQISVPIKNGPYSWSNQSYDAFDSTIVKIETDEGIYGVGEICPLGPAYLPAYAEGARTGIMTLAPGLIGEDPCNTAAIYARMDQLLKGHPYVKSAIDIACLDILGKSVNRPLYALLGGRLQDKVRLFKVVSRDEPEVMAEKLIGYQEQGFTQFQMKVGADPDVDIVRIRKVSSELKVGNKLGADANCGWRQHDAVRVVSAVSDLSFYLEQPCTTYEECRVVRDHAAQPMILDECMESLQVILRGHQDRAMDGINLKINRMGGLSKSRLIRDVCASLGIMMTIEDTWGGEIADAATAHLAHSTPRELHFQSSAFHEYQSFPIAEGGPVIKDGYMAMSDAPGLGVEPDWDRLGAPVASL
ncbi:mandelate racemase/muconate lactonizing enzyme family protein [Defluviimonas sp. WL0024]|uniref:Mandelate racemase/muconate lactonizing enzyme family protein n=1 Tax=Albidovulum salinarum TaxID=2984153 RepID=A0ABT2X8S7_9RHOB|nr:mandelate racemase/muconate lactonizing enzyme family protein [Defluviimonas sp. WL0024]MCU9850351.1 mandelate racemase/muconate lactonizing enzyme family protein [Defluviimonas sp. WL0024]